MTDDYLNPRKSQVCQALVAQGLLADCDSLSMVDVDGLRNTVRRLTRTFPDHFLHTFAVKSNLYVPILEVIGSEGMGAEVASPGEFELAKKAEIPFPNIVFDGPVKKTDEILQALDLGIAINIDNFQEFEIVADYFRNQTSTSIVGFRINPQIGAGSVALSSTATLTSKFGVGLQDPGVREKLLDLYQSHNFLNALHVHVGSVGSPLSLMTEGAEAILSLAREINDRVGNQQVRTIDIGGGLSVNFESDDDSPTFEDYASALQASSPELFDGSYKVITEFGRAIVAKNAFTIARIAYTKTMGGRPIALCHAGGHNLMRTIFQPEDWAKRVTALNSHGQVKSGTKVPQDVAGPLCFSGDIIAHERPLPELVPGDLVFVHDTGAYMFTNHFYYNAKPYDPVFGFESQGEEFRFIRFKAGQTLENLTSMFTKD